MRKFLMVTLLSSAIRFIPVLVVALALMIIGFFGSKVFFYIGLAVLILYFVLFLLFALHKYHLVTNILDKEEDFNKFIDHLQTNPDMVISEIMKKRDIPRN